MATPERKKEFAKRATDLHDYYINHIRKLQEARGALLDKYKGRVLSPWARPTEFMSFVDAERYQRLEDEEKEFENKVKRTTAEVLSYLMSKTDAEWERVPSTGVPGSLSQTNSRNYRSKLDDTYSLEVHWYDYPDDDGMVAESFRESYSAEIVGSRQIVTRKGIGGVGRKTAKEDFPMYYIRVSQQEDKREFRPSNETDQLLLDAGKRLRERLG